MVTVLQSDGCPEKRTAVKEENERKNKGNRQQSKKGRIHPFPFSTAVRGTDGSFERVTGPTAVLDSIVKYAMDGYREASITKIYELST